MALLTTGGARVRSRGRTRERTRAFLFIVTAVLCMGIGSGCRKEPAVSGVDAVKTILITERVSEADITVAPGREVRWINTRPASVRVIFLSSTAGRLSCNRGFAGFMEPVQSATIDPNEARALALRIPAPYGTRCT